MNKEIWVTALLQSLKEDAFLVRIKEEGPLDELWSQEAGGYTYIL